MTDSETKMEVVRARILHDWSDNYTEEDYAIAKTFGIDLKELEPVEPGTVVDAVIFDGAAHYNHPLAGDTFQPWQSVEGDYEIVTDG